MVTRLEARSSYVVDRSIHFSTIGGSYEASMSRRVPGELDTEIIGLVLTPDEAFFDGVRNDGEKTIEIALHVEQPARFLMEPQLPPCEDLEEFLERSPTTWECDEAVREFGH